MGIALPSSTLNCFFKASSQFFLVLIFVFSLTTGANAQNGSVGIGTNTPNSKAVLDIVSSTKGLLVPRLTQVQRDVLLVPLTSSPLHNGMLIYNTDSKEFNVWKDDNWVVIGAAVGAPATPGAPGSPASPASPINAWLLSGNAGTPGNISTYLGTTDAQPLIVATNGTERIRITSAGNVGIGIEDPTVKLHVAGDLKIGLLGDKISKVLKVSIEKNMSIILAGNQSVEEFSIPNCLKNSVVSVSPERPLPAGVLISYARVSADAFGALPGKVEVTFYNTTAAPVDPDSMKFHITVVE